MHEPGQDRSRNWWPMYDDYQDFFVGDVVGKTTWLIYEKLRRHIWRKDITRQARLQADVRLLVAFIGQADLAMSGGITRHNVWFHITKLEKLGWLKRINVGGDKAERGYALGYRTELPDGMHEVYWADEQLMEFRKTLPERFRDTPLQARRDAVEAFLVARGLTSEKHQARSPIISKILSDINDIPSTRVELDDAQCEPHARGGGLPPQGGPHTSPGRGTYLPREVDVLDLFEANCSKLFGNSPADTSANIQASTDKLQHTTLLRSAPQNLEFASLSPSSAPLRAHAGPAAALVSTGLSTPTTERRKFLTEDQIHQVDHVPPTPVPRAPYPQRLAAAPAPRASSPMLPGLQSAPRPLDTDPKAEGARVDQDDPNRRRAGAAQDVAAGVAKAAKQKTLNDHRRAERAQKNLGKPKPGAIYRLETLWFALVLGKWPTLEGKLGRWFEALPPGEGGASQGGRGKPLANAGKCNRLVKAYSEELVSEYFRFAVHNWERIHANIDGSPEQPNLNYLIAISDSMIIEMAAMTSAQAELTAAQAEIKAYEEANSGRRAPGALWERLVAAEKVLAGAGRKKGKKG